MHINIRYRLGSLIYLTLAFALALPVLGLLFDLLISGMIVDIWREQYSFIELLATHRGLCLKLSGVGAGIGFVYWLFYLRRYRYHDPLDKYFK